MSDEEPPVAAEPSRFDVVVTSWANDTRPRYCVVDYQTREYRFASDPFDRDQTRALCRRLQTEARARGEPTTRGGANP